VEHQQQPVMQPNRVIDLLVDLPPTLYVVRRKPAPHALGLQVGMQPLGKLLVAGRVADEAGVVPKWLIGAYVGHTIDDICDFSGGQARVVQVGSLYLPVSRAAPAQNAGPIISEKVRSNDIDLFPGCPRRKPFARQFATFEVGFEETSFWYAPYAIRPSPQPPQDLVEPLLSGGPKPFETYRQWAEMRRSD
jgi:hypothetical protein